jgi:hypothetical protein
MPARRAFKPLTERDIAQGRLRLFRITLHPDDTDEPEVTMHIGAVSAAGALRVLADRLEHPLFQGPDWIRSPELANVPSRRPGE